MIFTLGEGKQESWAIETKEPECEWDHMLTPLSKYKNQPFAVGSFLEYGQNTKKPNRAEMFDLTFRSVFNKLTGLKLISEKMKFILKLTKYCKPNQRKWIQMPEFPFHPDLYSFSSYRTLTVNDAVFIFGGWGNGLPLADVAKFENNVWYKMTDMLRWDFQIFQIFSENLNFQISENFCSEFSEIQCEIPMFVQDMIMELSMTRLLRLLLVASLLACKFEQPEVTDFLPEVD